MLDIPTIRSHLVCEITSSVSSKVSSMTNLATNPKSVFHRKEKNIIKKKFVCQNEDFYPLRQGRTFLKEHKVRVRVGIRFRSLNLDWRTLTVTYNPILMLITILASHNWIKLIKWYWKMHAVPAEYMAKAK